VARRGRVEVPVHDQVIQQVERRVEVPVSGTKVETVERRVEVPAGGLHCMGGCLQGWGGEGSVTNVIFFC